MIRVVVVVYEPLVRAGLRTILESASDISVVAEAANGEDAVAAVLRTSPGVVLMDVRMPGMDGLAAAAKITGSEVPARVVMLTTFDLDEYVHEALRLGAAGFLLKDTPPRDLVTAVRTVVEGNAMLAPTVTKRLIDSCADRRPYQADAARERLAVLIDRKHEVLQAVAKGLSNAEIGRALSMREATVKAHVSRSLAKLGLTNRVQAALLVHDAAER
ncbi:MAG: response regulator [Streptosporangiales bacterium]|nr:response regulator [Streptosporangiales bacterium]